MEKITGEEILITPELATEWLALNEGNRPIKAHRIKLYARYILAGKWVRHAQGIQFDTDRQLLDGQNRLMAIIAAATPTWMFVAHGVPRESRNWIDTGMNRTASDALAMVGAQNTRDLAAAIRLYIIWKAHDKKKEGRAIGAAFIHPEDIAGWYCDHEEWCNEAITWGRSWEDVASRSLASALYLILSEVDKNDAQVFFEAVGTGANLQRGSPLLALRNRLVTERQRKKGQDKYRQELWFELVFKAWNKFRKQESAFSLSARRKREGGMESYPVPI